MKEKLEISTKDRQNYTTTSSHCCSIPLEKTFSNIKNVKLVNAQIPMTYFIFNTTNNVVKTSFGTAIITAGNYTILELITEMTSVLNTATSKTWTISYSNKTNKLTFTCSLAFQFLFSDTTNTACYNLGFTNIDTASSLTTSSTRSVNIVGEMNCYLRIKELQTPSLHTVKGTFFNFKIPITKNYNEIEYYTNQGDENVETCENIRALYNLSIELLKYDGTYLDLNNSDFNFEIEIEY